ncbi:MAG: amino acid permease [Candidatus Eremiobacterota bacterium]
MLFKQMFATKSLEMLQEEMDSGEHRLRRILGPVALTSLGVGAIIGTGIFVLVGLTAKTMAGPSLMLSFIVSGLGCAFAAFCYAEFAAMTPVAGSAYTYAYATLGEVFAWIIGWDLILEYAVGSATVAHGWSKYFLKLLEVFNLHVPGYLTNDPLTTKHIVTHLPAMVQGAYIGSGAPVSSWFNLPAFLIVWIITIILVKGIRESAGFNSAMVIFKVAIVFVVIIAGSFFIDTKNWHPFIPPEFGFPGVMKGAAYVFFAYIGFDSISTHAEEAVNPKRDVPIGIVASLAICTLLYILVAGVLTGMVPYKMIDIEAPVASAFSAVGWNSIVFIVSLGAIAGITSVLLVMMLSQPRIFLAMSRDGLMPKHIFAVVHPVFKTPHRATLLMGIVVSLGASLVPLEDLAYLVNIGTLLAFVIVCASVWLMRHVRPDHPRPFKCPWVPVVPFLGIAFNLGMMVYLGWMTWLRLFVWLFIGFIIYILYGRHHSVMHKQNMDRAVSE